MLPVNSRFSNRFKHHSNASAYCGCSQKWPKVPVTASCEQQNDCSCGEEDSVREWKWQNPTEKDASCVILTKNNQVVTFHPVYSSGTAAAKGDAPMKQNYHYYWEVKMLTDTYGTDIMIGMGTENVDITESGNKFSSLLGSSAESYGFSYTGKMQHNSKIITTESNGFCKGSIVGVRVDLWQGTLEFFVNRRSQGVSFYNLRRHPVLYPIVCSTAAQSTLKLIYAASWKASLMVDALKVLSTSAGKGATVKLPPGLWYRFSTQFWLTQPSKCCLTKDEAAEKMKEGSVKSIVIKRVSSPMKRRYWQVIPINTAEAAEYGQHIIRAFNLRVVDNGGGSDNNTTSQ